MYTIDRNVFGHKPGGSESARDDVDSAAAARQRLREHEGTTARNAGMVLQLIQLDPALAHAEADFIGPLLTTRYAVEAMRAAKSGGAIVNVASISALWHGRRTDTAAPAYDAAKAGLLRLTTGLAKLSQTDNIRVNCLAPGWIATDGPRHYWESLTPEQRVERGVPASLLTTDQVAAAVARLVKDESLAGRVVVWWSEDEPRLIEWGDPGYRKWARFEAPAAGSAGSARQAG